VKRQHGLKQARLPCLYLRSYRMDMAQVRSRRATASSRPLTSIFRVREVHASAGTEESGRACNSGIPCAKTSLKGGAKSGKSLPLS